MHFSYEEAVNYILDVPRFTKKNVPEDTERFFDFLGRPGENALIVHVAGTNGKGSVCAYISSVLERAGISTGLFSSPHLVDIRERFRLNGEMIGREAFASCLNRVMGGLEAFRLKTGKTEYHPTFFELLFFMGMLWFSDQKAEAVVLETGMGGRLDATNVVRRPAVCVITRIGMDHMEYLGDTKEKIAAEKAGIIKEGCPVVYDGTREDVSEVIEAYAAQMHSRAYAIRPEMYKILMNTHKTIDFSMDTGYYEPMDVLIDSVAEYQIMNAMEAVTAAEVMDIGLTEEDIHRGMERMHWQGRMETVLPGVILDGAHNDSGVEEFVKTARKFQKDTKLTLLFSCVKEKDYDGMIRTICESLDFESVVVTQIDSYRQVPSEELAQIFRKYTTRPVEEISFIDDAFDEAMKRKGDGVLFCVGSLYLVGSLKSLIRSRKNA